MVVAKIWLAMPNLIHFLKYIKKETFQDFVQKVADCE